MAEKTRTTRCFCGAVEVELQGEPGPQVYCHCNSCRSWLGAPIHAATLWPTPKVNVKKGADKIGMTKRTENSLRNFCTSCGSPVFVRHPAIGMTDVPAGTIPDFMFKPTLHVHYGEKVMPVKDGLPKFKDFPKEFGGSGATVPE
jgi:hypothetical protein